MNENLIDLEVWKDQRATEQMLAEGLALSFVERVLDGCRAYRQAMRLQLARQMDLPFDDKGREDG